MPTLTDSRSEELGITIRRRISDRDDRRELGDLARHLDYSRSWVSQELLGNPERVIRHLVVRRPDKAMALADFLRYPSLAAMLADFGILADTAQTMRDAAKIATARLTPDLRARGEAELEDFRRLPTKIHKVEFVTAGGGPTLNGDDEHPEGEAWLEDTGFLDKYPDGKYVRIDGKCMEPRYPEGWLAAVIPEPGLADYGTPVLVWFAGNGRKVKFLLQAREDGDHMLLQTNPPVGERRVIQAPIGSRILGVVVEVLPPVRPGHAPRLNQRELAEIISEDMPDLWDDL